ncbi:transposase [Streptomyces botrytidirepellens]|uniref:transposase n=1 Tax=Streptomyces botrytidirepellens TaxID=2486417 RepID=UPI002482BB3D|nr:transposase [Streptomyces botrytidirepellens]
MARAAANTVMPMAPPEGWVLRTLVTPRTGESTVGVHKRFCPGYGQVLNAQYDVGLWAASTTMCYPLARRLLLPPEWFQDEARRARASIPGNCTPETPVVCGLSAYLDLPDALRGRLPIVMDMRGVDIPAAVHQLRAVRVPFLVKAYRGLPMTVVDPALPHVAGRQSTYQIMAAAGKAVPGEVTALQPRDFTFTGKRSTLRVQRTWKRRAEGGTYLGAPKTKKFRRTLVLTPDQVALFQRACLGKQPQDLIFTAPGGQSWHSGFFFAQRWKPALDAANAAGWRRGRASTSSATRTKACWRPLPCPVKSRGCADSGRPNAACAGTACCSA